MPDQIHKALIAVMREVEPIAKDQRNQSQGYNFRGVDQVYNQCHPILARNGIYATSEILHDSPLTKHEVVVTETKRGPSTLTRVTLHMRFRYHAEDGSTIATEVLGEGVDYGGDKASNKAMSVADKYALLQLLKIPTAMVDPDSSGPPRDAPPVNDNRTQQQPREQRVAAEDVRRLIGDWKTLVANDGVEPDSEVLKSFVERITERQFNPLQSGEWTVNDYKAVRKNLDQLIANQKGVDDASSQPEIEGVDRDR